MSLVAEYQSGSDSDSGSNKGSVDSIETAGEIAEKVNGFSKGSEIEEKSNGTAKGPEHGTSFNTSPEKLPSATSALKQPVSAENSAFTSGYKNEEDNKTKVLEQHVKMVDSTKSVPVNGKVNGKVVCWMYRRGRCRLGKKCKMYHDSELRTTEAKQKASTENKCVEQPVHAQSPQKRSYDETVTEENEDKDGPTKKMQKKHFGLGDSIVPSKKVIQHFERISKESQPGQ